MRLTTLTAAAASMLLLASCGKKLGQMSSDYFTVNPSPLEVVGETVPATVTGKIPGKFFLKNAEVTVTPYLVFDGTELASTPYTFQGESVRGNNPVVNFEYGGTVTIPAAYKYSPEQDRCELWLDFSVRQGGKQYALPRVKVADGLLATAALADPKTVTPAIAPDKFQRIINKLYAADIKFLINQANLRNTELTSEQMQALRAELLSANKADNRQIAEINISSYASPDGSYDFNQTLAENREKATSGYLQGQLKKDKITEFGELTSQFTAEDWEGFQKLVAASNIQDKDLILSVLSQFKDPEQREREIRNLSSVFDQLADQILPQLRYSRITASINVIGKSDEEIARLAAENPQALTADELLYAATLTDDNSRRMDIYNAATRLFPDDYRGWNDLGMAQYAARKYSDARDSFRKASKLAPANALEPTMNLGLCDLLDGEYSKAKQNFGNAAGVGELGEALGVYYLKTGDNASAVRAFGDSRSNNAALAQILTKDYSRARSTLAGINNPDATTYYLMAVLGARTNNEQMILSNLRQAIRLDGSMLQKAQRDLEFANFNLSGL